MLDEALATVAAEDRHLDSLSIELVLSAKAACEAARLLCYRVIDERANDIAPSANTNIARVAMVQAERLVAVACANLAGMSVLNYSSIADHQIRKSLAAGIAAGTYEVQLNLIARRHLDLPKG